MGREQRHLPPACVLRRLLLSPEGGPGSAPAVMPSELCTLNKIMSAGLKQDYLRIRLHNDRQIPNFQKGHRSIWTTG